MLEHKDKQFPGYFLPVLPEGIYPLSPDLQDLPELIKRIGSSNTLHVGQRIFKRAPIYVSSEEITTENYSGESSREFISPPVSEGEGICLGERRIHVKDTDFDSFSCGFKLWALSPELFSLHLFVRDSHTSGRLSGLGYTGSEDTTTKYRSHLTRTARLTKAGICLEREARERLIDVDDTRRLKYSSPLENDTEFHILDWDDDSQTWTNSCRTSFGSPKWSFCPLDESAQHTLNNHFSLVAATLEVDYDFPNARKLVEKATAGGRGFLGRYQQKVHRNPSPGEQERGIVYPYVNVNVNVFHKGDRTIILLKEKPII